jgi:hypothetical protein
MCGPLFRRITSCAGALSLFLLKKRRNIYSIHALHFAASIAVRAVRALVPHTSVSTYIYMCVCVCVCVCVCIQPSDIVVER